MSLETCPTCGKEFIPIWENKKIKCKKCKSKINIEDFAEINEQKFQHWDNNELIELVVELGSRLESILEEYKELESRVETLGIIVEQDMR